MSGMEFQSELPFGEAAQSDGYNAWLEQRRRAEAEAARRLGIPLGHRVEVWLKDGVRLRGTLKLFEEMLVIDALSVDALKLTVDKTPFCCSDMESCLRLD